MLKKKERKGRKALKLTFNQSFSLHYPFNVERKSMNLVELSSYMRNTHACFYVRIKYAWTSFFFFFSRAKLKNKTEKRCPCLVFGSWFAKLLSKYINVSFVVFGGAIIITVNVRVRKERERRKCYIKVDRYSPSHANKVKCMRIG